MKIFVRSRHFYKTLAVLAVPIALQSMITVGVNMDGQYYARNIR